MADNSLVDDSQLVRDGQDPVATGVRADDVHGYELAKSGPAHMAVSAVVKNNTSPGTHEGTIPSLASRTTTKGHMPEIAEYWSDPRSENCCEDFDVVDVVMPNAASQIPW